MTNKSSKKRCKECGPGTKPCRCGKADKAKKSPYADGCAYCKDSVAASFNEILLDSDPREDKPCGASYIPKNAKCRKGPGQAKKPQPKKGTIGFVEQTRSEKNRAIRLIAGEHFKGEDRKKLSTLAKNFKKNPSADPDMQLVNKVVKRELFNRNVRNVRNLATTGGIVVAGGMLGRRLKRK